MDRIRFLFCFCICLSSFITAFAAGIEPQPAYKSVYTSVYEQAVLLAAMQKEQADPLKLLLAGAPEMSSDKEEAFRAELDGFVKKMQKHKAKSRSEKFFLNQLYYATHRKFLKEYKLYHNFYSLLENGSYNCLSGTALYGWLLDELDVSYQIYESDYHIFLLVTTDEGEKILIESTDPLNGFIEGSEQIKNRMEEIREDAGLTASKPDKPYHAFEEQALRTINLRQLAGLQYYNQAVNYYNTRRVQEAENALGKGRLLYQASRFDKFQQLLAGL